MDKKMLNKIVIEAKKKNRDITKEQCDCLIVAISDLIDQFDVDEHNRSIIPFLKDYLLNLENAVINWLKISSYSMGQMLGETGVDEYEEIVRSGRIHQLKDSLPIPYDEVEFTILLRMIEVSKRQISYLNLKSEKRGIMALPEYYVPNFEGSQLSDQLKMFISQICMHWRSHVDPALGLPTKGQNKTNPLLRSVDAALEIVLGNKRPNTTTVHHFIYTYVRDKHSQKK